MSMDTSIQPQKDHDMPRSRAPATSSEPSSSEPSGGDPSGGKPGDGLSTEFASVPFQTLIGAPLLAAVDAQRQSAQVTLNFLKDMLDDDDQVRTVLFKYKKDVTTGETTARKDVELEVPLLVLMPLPFLRIDYMNVKFNVKLTSHHKETAESSTDAHQEWNVKGGYMGINFGMSGFITHKSKQSKEDEVHREYSMEVQVHAVQDKMPGGMERVLSLLENCIQEK